MVSRRTLLGASAMSMLLARPVLAAFPDRPVRVIVPFAPGGNADTVARLVGAAMAGPLRGSVIVDNKPGAAGTIGAEFVARAAPDGYTLLSGSNGPLINNMFIQDKVPYDTLKDFSPIGISSIVPHALAVNLSVPARTLEEFITLSKTHPVGVATSGVGSATHFTLARLISKTNAKLFNVPYKSGGAMLPDLLGGNVQAEMTELSTVLPLHIQGKLRILGFAAARRSALAPDIPTMIEAGVPDFIAGSYVGLLAPAKTPPDAIARLQKAMATAVSSKAVLDRFAELAISPVTADLMTPDGFMEFLRKDYQLSKEATQLPGFNTK